MPQSVIKTATTFSGIASYPNVLSQVQPGALASASNVNIDKPGTLSVRRGMGQWASGSSSGKAVPSRIFQTGNSMFGFFTADGLPSSSGYLGRLDSPNVTAFISTLLTPPPGNAIHSFQANNNIFLNTDDGIYKLMALYSGGSAGDVVPAGVPMALDTQATLTSPQPGSAGFLAGGYATAYRVLWGVTDTAGNVNLGAPSPSVTVQNPLVTGTSVGTSSRTSDATTFTVTLPYTPGASGTINNAYVVQGSTVLKCTLTVNGTATATVNIPALTTDQTLAYFGPSSSTLTLVVPVTITAVSGTTLTTGIMGTSSGIDARVLGTTSTIAYAPFNTSSPSATTSATVQSTITGTAASSITVAGGTWTTGQIGVTISAQVATAQGNNVLYSGTAPQVGDYLVVPGSGQQIAVTTVTTGTTTITLASFPTGMTFGGGTNGTVAASLARGQNVTVSFVVPQEINAYTSTSQTLAVFYQVYRSYVQFPITSGVIPTPTDNMQLAYQANVTGTFTGSSNDVITVLDVAPDATLGTALYTSPNQQGILASQYPPPVASDAAYYSNSTLLANVYLPASASGQLLGAGGISIGNVSYTASSNVASVTSTAGMAAGGRLWYNGQCAIITSILSSTTVQILTAATSTVAVSSIYLPPGAIYSSDYVIINGVYFVAITGAPGASNQFQISANAALTASQNLNATVANFARAVNSYFVAPTSAGNAHEQIAVIPTSTATSQAGLFTIQVNRGLGTFSIQQAYTNQSGLVVSTGLTPYIQGIPVGPTTYSPTNQQNALYFSASNQPEAVPLTNFIQVGSPNYPIQRVVAIPGSCLIFKPDGVYQLTGSTPGTFAAQLFNNTVQLLANESIAIIQSSVIAYTTQGVVTIANGNVQVTSMAINDDLMQLYQLPAFASTAFGVAQEKERRYLLFSPSVSGDTLPTQVFAYNVNTNAWTKWALPGTQQVCGLVNIADQLLYLGCTGSAVLGTAAVFQERSGTTATAYGDESFSSSTYTASGKSVTFTGLSSNLATAFGAGTAVVNASGQVFVALSSSGTSTTLTLNFAAAPGLSGTVTVVQPTAWSFSTIPIGADDAGTVKQFQEFAFDCVATSLGSFTATTATDYYADTTPLPMVPYAAGTNYAVARQLVTRNAARGHTFWPTVSGTLAQQTLNLAGLTLQWVPQQTMRSR